MLRRSVIILLGVAMIGVPALAAYGSGSSSSNTLVVDDNFSFLVGKGTDPARGGVDIDTAPFFHAVYETLLTYKLGNTSTPVPDVALSYKASPDAKKFTFTLRKDVHFSNGDPLTAADVVFTYKRLLNLNDTPAYLLDGITGASAPSKYTFVLQSSASNPAIPAIVTNQALGIVDSKVLRAHGGLDTPDAAKKDTASKYLETHSVGSGPYVLVSANTSQIVMKANPGYRGATKPTFTTIIYRCNIPAATQQINARRGKNEIELNLSGDQANSLKGSSNLNVTAFTSANLYYLFVNHDPNITAAGANPHFVNAVRYGLDYSGLVQLGGAGAARAAGPIPSQFLGALPRSAALKRDVALAKSELAASGLDHPSIQLNYETTSTGISEALAAKIKADLGSIGIDVQLNGQPGSISLPNLRANKDPMSLRIWVPDYPDPNDYLSFLPGQIVGNHAGWKQGANLGLERAGAQASATSNNKLRAKLFRDIQMAMKKQSPIFPLFNPGQVLVSSKNLTKVILNPVWYLSLADIGTTK
jgi:peptide/nickel transport system substrate-binding protein